MLRGLLCLWLATLAASQAYFAIDDKVSVQWYMSSSVAFTLRVTMPNKYYVAFSYGGTHINSDMVVLKANGTSS